MKNLRILNKAAMAIMSIAFVFGLTSCCDDDDVITPPYIDITAVTSCSPDLLQFVTPTVTITGDNGESQSFVLSPSDFKESNKGGTIEINVTVNGVTTSTSSTATNFVANVTKKFDREMVSGEIKVSYALKENAVFDKEQYIFFHGIGYDSKTVKDGFSFALEGAYIKPIAHEVSNEKVLDYLTELVAEVDKTSFKVTIQN